MNQLERLTRVETKMSALEEKVDRMEGKIDELLALRYKGTGAFWLASSLIGTGIIGALFQLIAWIRS